MTERTPTAEVFEAERARLRRVAARLVGSSIEAEDVVQEAWLRLAAADRGSIDRLPNWLTTVTARICLDVLRARRLRPQAAQLDGAEQVVDPGAGAHQERDLLLAESVGGALSVVLERLTPAERVAFVLHDLFGAPFDEVARTLDRTPVAARQLASRGRRRARGCKEPSHINGAEHARAVTAFYLAARGGDFQALLNILAPDAELQVVGPRAETPDHVSRGATQIARRASAGAVSARGSALLRFGDELVILDADEGRLWLVMLFEVAGERITRVQIFQNLAPTES